MIELASAIERLKTFRCSLYDGDVIDEASDLSVADLDIIIAAVDDLVPTGSATLDQLAAAPPYGNGRA